MDDPMKGRSMRALAAADQRISLIRDVVDELLEAGPPPGLPDTALAALVELVRVRIAQAVDVIVEDPEKAVGAVMGLAAELLRRLYAQSPRDEG